MSRLVNRIALWEECIVTSLEMSNDRKKHLFVGVSLYRMNEGRERNKK